MTACDRDLTDSRMSTPREDAALIGSLAAACALLIALAYWVLPRIWRLL